MCGPGLLPLLNDALPVASPGGNLATVDELSELSRDEDVHVLTNFNKIHEAKSFRRVRSVDEAEGIQDLPDDQISDQAKEVLLFGSTAVNFLVWRRSMLIISMVVLFINLLREVLKIYKFATQIFGTTLGDLVTVDHMQVASDPDGDPDLFAVVGGHVNNTCFVLCELQGFAGFATASAGSSCGDLCNTLTTSITGADEQNCPVDPVAPTLVVEEASAFRRWLDGETWTMADRFCLYKLLCEMAKLITSALALGLFWRAEKEWRHVKPSSTLISIGWRLVFATPLLLSVVPWYNVLGFTNEFEGKHLMEQVPGHLKGIVTRLKLGTGTYLQTQAMALALFKSAMVATIQCKQLVPRSGLWSQAFFLAPILQVVLQWPLFGTWNAAISALCSLNCSSPRLPTELVWLLAPSRSNDWHDYRFIERLDVPDRVHAYAPVLHLVWRPNRPCRHPRQITQNIEARQGCEQVHEAACTVHFRIRAQGLGFYRLAKFLRGQEDIWRRGVWCWSDEILSGLHSGRLGVPRVLLGEPGRGWNYGPIPV